MKKTVLFLSLFACSLIACKSSVENPIAKTKENQQTVQTKETATTEKQFVLEHKVQYPSKKSTDKAPVLIMLHGMGTNEDNLFPFGPNLNKNLLFITARAPYKIAEKKFQWYQGSYASEKPVINLGQVEASRRTLLQFIDQVIANYDVDPAQIYLGGFSQGAIMSLAVGLTVPEKVKGIAAFSGRFIPELEEKLGNREALKKLTVFLSHGTKDNVLSYEFAETAKSLLEKLEVDLDFRKYDTRHTISRENLSDFLNWINSSMIKHDKRNQD